MDCAVWPGESEELKSCLQACGWEVKIDKSVVVRLTGRLGWQVYIVV